MRDRSEHDLRTALLRSGFPSNEVSQALDRLRRCGLLDDESFAERCASRSLRLLGEGPRKIRFTLARHGVLERTAKIGLDRALDETSEEEVIARLARDLWSRKVSLAPARRLAYVYSRLFRRGFSAARIARQLRRLHPKLRDVVDEMESGFESTSGENY